MDALIDYSAIELKRLLLLALLVVFACDNDEI
jgi:hypothetical protein